MSGLADEEARAAEFRAQQRRRAAFDRENRRRLAGSRSAILALRDRWAPVSRTATVRRAATRPADVPETYS